MLLLCGTVHGLFLLKILFQGIAAEKREAKAEKEEADKYHKLNQELVSQP